MQVSKWLGHSTFVLALTTYADYINEDEMAAPKVGRAGHVQRRRPQSTEDRNGLEEGGPWIRAQYPLDLVLSLVMQRYAFEVWGRPTVQRLVVVKQHSCDKGIAREFDTGPHGCIDGNYECFCLHALAVGFNDSVELPPQISLCHGRVVSQRELESRLAVEAT